MTITSTNLVPSGLARMLAWVRLSRWAPWLVLAVSLAITYQVWKIAQQNALQELQTNFDFRVRETRSRIEQRMLAYEQVLRGAQGLFASSISVERDEFRSYNDKLHLHQNYPGIQGIGFAVVVPPAEKNKFISTIRKQGLPQFNLWPEGKRDFFTSIIYIEPFSERNLAPLGYDMYTEPVRRAAMERARDTDQATLSGRLTLVADKNERIQAGFKMYLPVYKNGVPHDTLAERRANLSGWIYGLFRMDDLMQGILGEHTGDIDTEIFDGKELSNETQMYDADHVPSIVQNLDSRFRSITQLEIAGRNWTVAILSMPAFNARLDSGKPRFIAVSGIGASILLALLAWLLDIRLRALQVTRELNRELVESEERWRFALEGSGEGVWDWNVQTGETNYSIRWKEILGYGDDVTISSHQAWLDHLHPDDKPRVVENIQQYLDNKLVDYTVEYRLRCKDGSYKWILGRGMVVSRDGKNRPLRMIGTQADITQRKESEELIWRQANYDSLTHLPNRRMFRDRLEQEIRQSHRSSLPFALLFLDLDQFKEINDTLGHGIGDKLLTEAARRLVGYVRKTDTVARLGGDEFTIILGALDDPGSVGQIAQNLLQKMIEPFQLEDEMIYISASIGITMYPEDASNIDDLLKNADQAMYAAKQQGRNRFNYFTPSMQKVAQARMRMVNDLRSALVEQQFVVHYQPIVELATGTIQKAEALIRWRHPALGVISPEVFIPIAEETGMIIDIGNWVFHEAVRQAKRWRTLYHATFQISVNKSPVQFRNEGTSHAAWFYYLSEIGLPGQSIVVEITEGLLLDPGDNTNKKLLELRDAGIQVSLDDFGTGYSSLSYLKKFDIDYLKIDKSFMRNLLSGSDDMVLCEAIIVMAHKLGLQVIAEGIETTEQRDLLAQAGCDYGQGYLFSRPMPAEEFEKLLEKE